MQNSILSATKVRQLTPDDLGISPPGDGSSDADEANQDEARREAAETAASTTGTENGGGVAVSTSDGELFTGVTVGGDGWGVHAVELAVSKAVSNGKDVEAVSVFTDAGEDGLCGRCLQALADSRDGDVVIEMLTSEGVEEEYNLEEIFHPP